MDQSEKKKIESPRKEEILWPNQWKMSITHWIIFCSVIHEAGCSGDVGTRAADPQQPGPPPSCRDRDKP